MHRPKIVPRVVLASALLLAGAALFRHAAHAEDRALAAIAPAAAAAIAPPAAAAPAPLGPMRFDPERGRWVAPLGGGTAVLTIDPRLQSHLERFLAQYAVPYGAVVLLEPATGRVLALAEHSQAEPGRRGLPLESFAPAASVFKIVTSAALLEQGVVPQEEVCYHGGRHRLQPRLLADDPRRDHACTTLSAAFGRSTNVVFAKLAGRGLSADVLRAEADRFLFNAPIPFSEPVAVSPAEISSEPFALANTAAGFGPVRLSPLHGALLAAIVANGGTFVPPTLVEGAAGVAVPPAAEPRRIVDERIAGEIAEMMRRTVTDGTARHAFRRPPPSLRGVSIAGKTGSLAERSPYRDYSWFVGFAPADHPRIAIAAVVGNGLVWRIRAAAVAREALAEYFADHVADAAPAVPAVPGRLAAVVPASRGARLTAAAP